MPEIEKEKEKEEVATNKLLKILRDRDAEVGEVQSDEPDLAATQLAPDVEDDSDDLIGGGPSPEAAPAEVATPTVAPPSRPTIEPVPSKDWEEEYLSQPPKEKSSFTEKKEGFAGLLYSLKQYIFKDKIVTGVVIDKRTVSTVSIDDKEGVKRVVGYSIAQIPPDINESDEEQDSTVLSETLREIMPKKKSKRFFTLRGEEAALPGKVVTCFSENSAVTKYLELPDVSKKELAQAIDWNARRDLPFSAEELTVDSINQVSIDGSNGQEGHLLLGVADEKEVNEHLKTILESGLTPRKFTTIPYGVWNAFIWNYPELSNEHSIIVYIGDSKTIILFIHRRVLRFVREFSMGSNAFSKALPTEITLGNDRVKVTPRVAETLMWKFKIPIKETEEPEGADQQNTQLSFYFRPILEKLVDEITRSFNLHRKDFPIQKVKRIFLTGPGAGLRNMQEYLSGNLGKKVILLNSLRNLKMKYRSGNEVDSSTSAFFLATATGLALNAQRGINLLPKVYRREEIFMIANTIGGKVFPILFAVLVSLSGITQLYLKGVKLQLSTQRQIEAQLAPVRDQYNGIIQDLTDMETRRGSMEGDKNYFEKEVTILKLLSNVTPVEINLTYLSFQKGWETTKERRVGRKLIMETEVESPAEDILRLEGVVKTNPALREAFLSNYVNSLNTTNLFANISIEDKQSVRTAEIEGLSFTLKCQL